eukprot:GHVS01083283.1.p1 GENE.GHVS01083283.1~~GHVS01083283.1.p1  ORF type:complete len:282 (+),score=16.42 GHVS01083283.1:430-1275(+)
MEASTEQLYLSESSPIGGVTMEASPEQPPLVGLIVKVAAWMGLITHSCETTLGRNPFDAKCSNQLLMSLLDVAIIFGATIVKLPQILKIQQAQNVAGLNESSFVIEVFAGSLFVGYNILEGYPFSTWGDVAIVVLQCIVLVLLYWVYSHPTEKDNHGNLRSVSRIQSRTTYSALWVAMMAVILSGWLPKGITPILGLSPVPCSVCARVPQILQNFRQKHTGQLSLLTLTMMVSGNIVRLLTTLHLNDNILIASNLIASVTNGIPLLQIMWYRANTAKLKKT